MKFLIAILCFGLLHASELETISGVVFVPTEWADGDSFRVRLPDGEEHTLRLYGADCIEWHVADASDARRLRAQRRYFGISEYGNSSSASIELAKSLGEAAGVTVRAVLAQPFTLHTSFADGRGDERYSRIYAFVTTPDGQDLATRLVSAGLARAYGVTRSTADARSRDEYRETLRDAELIAARTGRGAWKYTDWSRLPEERRQQREEEREERMALGTAEPVNSVDLNTASRDELMRIPGVGEITALEIISSRPFDSVDDLLRVRGIGQKTLESLRPWVSVAD